MSGVRVPKYLGPLYVFCNASVASASPSGDLYKLAAQDPPHSPC